MITFDINTACVPGRVNIAQDERVKRVADVDDLETRGTIRQVNQIVSDHKIRRVPWCIDLTQDGGIQGIEDINDLKT